MTRSIHPVSFQSHRPLTFDRANRGRPIKSTFPLFRLPIEILQDVAPHIPSLDLETLALVDRDCRQLARSVQFSSVRLTYNDASLGLLETLLEETQTHEEFSQAIGPCIRHFTIDLGLPKLTEARLTRYPNLFAFYQRLPEPSCPQDAFLAALATVLSCSLPNLQSLAWQSRVVISSELLQAIVFSKARTVAISQALVHTNMDVFDLYGGPRWPIENLVLDTEWTMPSFEDSNSITNVMTDILRAVSPTLQRLSWRGLRCPSSMSFGREKIIFPRLRALRLDAVPMADFTILSSLLSFNDRILSLEVSSTDRATAEFLASRGHMEALESFSWLNQRHYMEEDIILFLEANTQLRSLSIGQSLPPITIETRILPIVKSDYLRLTSLHLVWDALTIPDTALSVIGTLHQLQRLWLSAGAQHGWCNNWKIEHDVLLRALQPLHRLESLTFSRDSYEVHGHPLLDSSIEKYYHNAVFPYDVNFQDYLTPDERSLLEKAIGLASYVDMTFEQARSLQSRLMKAAWERWHQQRMLGFAGMYAKMFARLEWCYMGQYHIKVERIESRTCVVVESPIRENLKPL
ncbi:hypothetical protein C8R42DRAFT_73158 [Lentinula raphanica]|nr:hypothetical protein C8R42DRAFT_73158 [Lentinula raphanica]